MLIPSCGRLLACTRLLAVLGLVACAGCESLGNKKFENPVSGPPPKRINVADVDLEPEPALKTANAEKRRTDSKSVEQTGFRKDNTEPEFAPGGEVAVVVNGEPLFVDEILEALPPEAQKHLEAARRQMTPEEYATHRRRAAKYASRSAIERAVLVQALHEVNKPEKLKALTGALDKQFEVYLKETMKQMNISTKGELMVRLQEQGTSVTALKDAFVRDQMARFYIGETAPEPKKPDRPQLLAYYEEHLPDYTFVGQVRWQQIVLATSDHGGEAGALELAGQLAQQIRAGADFGELAKKHSSGSTASEGGVWDWTREGSLASKDVEKQLFSLPVGGVSPPIVRKDRVEIVRVLERKEGGRKPFESVQKEIEEQLVQKARQGAVQDVIAGLVERAEITMMIEEE